MPKIVTEEKKREIKRMLEEGRLYKEIRETLHVASNTIAMVKAELGGGKNLPFLQAREHRQRSLLLVLR